MIEKGGYLSCDKFHASTKGFRGVLPRYDKESGRGSTASCLRFHKKKQSKGFRVLLRRCDGGEFLSCHPCHKKQSKSFRVLLRRYDRDGFFKVVISSTKTDPRVSGSCCGGMIDGVLS